MPWCAVNAKNEILRSFVDKLETAALRSVIAFTTTVTEKLCFFCCRLFGVSVEINYNPVICAALLISKEGAFLAPCRV